MKKLIEKLEYGLNPRETLAAVADLLGGMLPIEIEEYHIPLMNYVPAYFENADAKVRKNAAKVIGFVDDPLVPSILIRAFEKETVLYVRPTYLKALKRFRVDEPILAILKARRDAINSADIAPEERKHLNEELQAIEECIDDNSAEGHTFSGWWMDNEVVLVTEPVFAQLTASLIDEPRKKIISSGIYLKTKNLMLYKDIRTYRDILFFLPNLKSVTDDPYAAAMQLVDAGFVDWLQKRHDGDGPFRYRIEMTGVDEKKKTVLIKRLSGEILRLSNQKLIFSKDHYEMELRFAGKEDGSFRFFFRLMTLGDSRFAYRKEAVAASIKPVTAAAFLKKFESYLKPDAQVLDPFCGVGTMLFERNLLKPVKAAFGVDTFGEAIDKARKNGNEAEFPIYFIHRDFFDFRHDRLFDEIVTNMPFSMKENDTDKIDTIHYRFFTKAKEHLNTGAYILMLSRYENLVRKYCTTGYRIEEYLKINEKTGLCGFVIKKL